MTATEFGELRPDGERCAVRFERLYDFTTDEVWRALTEPEQLPGWLGHASRWTLAPEEEYELDVGGPTTGRIAEVEPGRVLELTWTWGDEPESVVRFELEPRGDGCLLILDHRRLDRESGVGYSAGWHAHLDALERLLAGTGPADWEVRYRELRPPYEEQAAAIRWDEPESSRVRAALYRGDREAAEAAATGDLDVFDAAALGRVARLRELLDADPELVRALSNDGFTPLHLACFSGGLDAVRLLIERGAPLEALSQSPIARVRPLGTAAFARSHACVRALVEAGADPNGQGAGGFAPLHTAARNGDEETARLLLEHGADATLAAGRIGLPADIARAAGHAELADLLSPSRT